MTARTGNDITVKTVEGKTVTVALDPAFTVNHTVKAKLADIKPGDFVGTGAYPDGDAWKAAEVHIFPKGSRQGEGHRPWSSDPTGTMTNAEVTADVVASGKNQLTLTTAGKSFAINVPDSAPIVRFTEGGQDLVKKGAWVGISNAVEKDGKLFGRGTSDMKSFVAVALALAAQTKGSAIRKIRCGSGIWYTLGGCKKASSHPSTHDCADHELTRVNTILQESQLFCRTLTSAIPRCA